LKLEIEIKYLKIKIGDDHAVRLFLSDFNRLRWTLCAVERNLFLQNSLLNCDVAYITDSILLMNNPMVLYKSSNILLWDGFNSYIELLNKLPSIGDRADLIYLYVGSFKELKYALPAKAITLFAYEGLVPSQKVKVPLIFRLFALVRTNTRFYKNWMSDRARHNHLLNRRNIVFCGLVTPSEYVVKNFLRGTQLTSLAPVLKLLCELDWQQNYDEIKLTIIEVLEKVRLSKSQNPADLSCIYSIFNICHRLVVLSYLHSKNCDLFISEYGRHKHIDPYDTFAYQQNLFVDFGSSRGPDEWYPRTIDMQNTNKKFVSLRFLHESQSMLDCLETTSAEAFINLCESGALQVLKTFQAHKN
jgi:hypothetical protein